MIAEDLIRFPSRWKSQIDSRFRFQFNQHCPRQLCCLQRELYTDGHRYIIRGSCRSPLIQLSQLPRYSERNGCGPEWDKRELHGNDTLRFHSGNDSNSFSEIFLTDVWNKG